MIRGVVDLTPNLKESVTKVLGLENLLNKYQHHNPKDIILLNSENQKPMDPPSPSNISPTTLPSPHPLFAPPRPPIVLKFIEIIFYAFGYLNKCKFVMFSDLNNVENELELENVNCDFDLENTFVNEINNEMVNENEFEFGDIKCEFENENDFDYCDFFNGLLCPTPPSSQTPTPTAHTLATAVEFNTTGVVLLKNTILEYILGNKNDMLVI